MHRDSASKPGPAMSLAPDVLTGFERYLERGVAGGELVEYSIYDNPSVAENAAPNCPSVPRLASFTL